MILTMYYTLTSFVIEFGCFQILNKTWYFPFLNNCSHLVVVSIVSIFTSLMINKIETSS